MTNVMGSYQKRTLAYGKQDIGTKLETEREILKAPDCIL